MAFCINTDTVSLFAHNSMKWNDDTDAFNEPEQCSNPIQALITV